MHVACRDTDQYASEAPAWNIHQLRIDSFEAEDDNR